MSEKSEQTQHPRPRIGKTRDDRLPKDLRTRGDRQKRDARGRPR